MPPRRAPVALLCRRSAVCSARCAMAAARDEGAAARMSRLGAACAACFVGGGVLPDAALVEDVAAALNCITAADVGLADEATSQDHSPLWQRMLDGVATLVGARAAPPPPPISYLRLHEGPLCTVGIFCLPAGAVIPLHDHPGMTVLSRVLYGQLAVRSLDWAPAGPGAELGKQLGGAARLRGEEVIRGPARARTLRPSQGNLHAFRALSACAVLDVLAPPYSAREGRECTYYTEVASSPSLRLAPLAPPPWLVIRSAPYHGTPLTLPHS